jgi:hypothetical protein
MRIVRWVVTGFLFVSTCDAFAQTPQGNEAAKTQQSQTAAKPQPVKVEITVEELKGLPRKTVTVLNPHANAVETYEGVALADVLGKHGVPLGAALRGAAIAWYVVATGADGYKAVYSLAEVDPSFHPGDVIVADTMEGKALDAHSGPFRLVSTEDKRPARGVRNLVSVEVKAAE